MIDMVSLEIRLMVELEGELVDGFLLVILVECGRIAEKFLEGFVWQGKAAKLRSIQF